MNLLKIKTFLTFSFGFAQIVNLKGESWTFTDDTFKLKWSWPNEFAKLMANWKAKAYPSGIVYIRVWKSAKWFEKLALNFATDAYTCVFNFKVY